MKYTSLLVILLLAQIVCATEKADFASIFSDNMVLQQQTIVNLWGTAMPNEKLTVECSWSESEKKTVADDNGFWSVQVQTRKGSFSSHSIALTNSEGTKKVLSNVLIGEVWLCSGQSNMEMVMKNEFSPNLIVENADIEIEKADYPNIRFVNIKRKESFFPQDNIGSYGWKICNPDNAKWLSAVAFFFGKKLFNELKIPVGLVVSAYGGSPIQSWIPNSVIKKNTEMYKSEIKAYNIAKEASSQTEEDYTNTMSLWIKKGEQQTTKNKDTIILNLPINLEKSSVGNQLGEVSFYREIDLSQKDISKDLLISLGTIDDLGRVYFNGNLLWEEIRNSHSYSKIQFTVPHNALINGTNTLEVKVLNILWGGGLTGPTEDMYYKFKDKDEKYRLDGEWQYSKIFDLKDVEAMPSEGKPLFSTVSALYNGMIHPITKFKFKGCLWYQGEENVGEAENYTVMFSDMITSWRAAFDTDFPFYYVQIAPYKYGGDQASKAAELREAQAKVEKLLHKTAMVSTIDIGNSENIHPAQKKEIGTRLSNVALSNLYGKDIPYKSPEITATETNNNSLILRCSNAYNGLTSQGQQHNFELSEDGQTFFPADAQVSGDSIIISIPKGTAPAYVRYCWGDADIGTIFNSENLPLSTFRLSINALNRKNE